MNDNLLQPVSEPYRKFFEKFKEIDKLSQQEWKLHHVLAYICRKYQQHYSFDYTFKFNDVPSKCYEIYCIRKLSQMLSSNPEILIQYIDWVFKDKVQERKKKITTLGYFTNVDMINDFKFRFLFNKPITRASLLPEKWLRLLQLHNKDIKTYGELAFLFKIDKPEDRELFKALSLDGFKPSSLENLK